MTDISDVVTDVDINRAIGYELRRLRDELRLTRADVVARIPGITSDQTVANYEAGSRPMTVPRLAEVCEIYGVATASVVSIALQRAGIERNPRTMLVDLSLIWRREDSRTRLVKWARKRQARTPDTVLVELSPEAIEEMAIFLEVPAKELIRELRSFTPERVPPRIEWTATNAVSE